MDSLVPNGGWSSLSVVVVGVGERCHVPAFMLSSPTTIPSAFEAFRNHLDEHYDRRERLIKVNFLVALA